MRPGSSAPEEVNSDVLTQQDTTHAQTMLACAAGAWRAAAQ